MDKKIKEKCDCTNKQFGRLTALYRARKDNVKYSQWYWNCRCTCGNEKLVRQSHLIKGKIQSCGCIKHDKRKSNHKLWTGYEDISGDFFGNIRRAAKSRNLEFSITKEELWKLFLLQNKKCALTDKLLNFPLCDNGYEGNASLDRIDNTKGYIIKNVQWVDKNVNTIKMDLTLTEFITMCKLVAKKYETTN